MAKIGATRAQVKPGGALTLAIDLYRTHVGAYPEKLSDLYTKPADEQIAKKWNGPYLNDAKALKDAWGNELQYKVPGSHNASSYDLWSVGPDGQDGTPDDIGNWARAGGRRRARQQ